MIPITMALERARSSIPRESGDDPCTNAVSRTRPVYSPRERG